MLARTKYREKTNEPPRLRGWHLLLAFAVVAAILIALYLGYGR
jgi:hypothetical protein